MGWKSSREDEFLYLKIAIAAAFAILLVLGLIEWNARRQAAAVERMLIGTPGQQAALQREIAQMEAEAGAEMRTLRRRLDPPPARPAQRVDRRPLSEGERCIDHQRFRRVDNGWLQVGTC